MVDLHLFYKKYKRFSIFSDKKKGFGFLKRKQKTKSFGIHTRVAVYEQHVGINKLFHSNKVKTEVVKSIVQIIEAESFVFGSRVLFPFTGSRSICLVFLVLYSRNRRLGIINVSQSWFIAFGGGKFRNDYLSRYRSNRPTFNIVNFKQKNCSNTGCTNYYINYSNHSYHWSNRNERFYATEKYV